ncbi:ferritin-like domain-containing protein [Hymenobacter gummosus]|uniref:Ferritin-like domain-containing protein n=1 Tax=Hymenobacter gummosus TaxID=1776032 RepID=A0A3S0K8X4_9BACT|nr:ferritin-like domain-containing protein [Hymenobacter gummosus]RTQ53565.1 ferritin-like domain-containing protein [Hymenobacter gummosus]
MDLYQIITDIEKVDPEVYARFDSRRQVFRHLTGIGRKLTAATLPGVFAGLFSKAYGQTGTLPAAIADVLNLALKLEYLEKYFYQTALTTVAFPNAEARRAIEIILNDENGHITTLRGALGAQAIADPGLTTFDYTGSRGGERAPLFPDVLTNFATFITVSQSFVDTGVRAYKGGAPVLMPNKDILQTALNIHSVEARHSSRVRALRRGGNLSTSLPKSWIVGDEGYAAVAGQVTPLGVGLRPYGPGNPATTYPAENNITQAGVNIQTTSSISANAATEAFDEPLDPATVMSIARNFVVRTSNIFG